MNQKKENLEKTIEVSKVKLDRAERLTSLLADEGLRWRNAVVDLQQEKQTLIGDVFLSSAIISYFGPLSS
jgi:dynein heavy chain